MSCPHNMVSKMQQPQRSDYAFRSTRNAEIHSTLVQTQSGSLVCCLAGYEGALLASERFQWFAFNEKKGWTVLIAVAAVGLFLLFVFLGFTFALLFHWRFQFGIRSLLVLTVAVAIVGSWLAMEMQRAEKQRKAVAALRESDNHVYYDYQWNDSGARILPAQHGLFICLGMTSF